MFIIRCIPTANPTERNPKIYYYEGAWTDGTIIYNTSKTQAMRFNNRVEAERIANPLLLAGKIVSYKIELED